MITRRTQFDKNKAEARAHILEGLLIALDHLDEVIAIIRNSETDVIAQAELMSRFNLSERQSQAILDMRLRRLTGLERDKIQSEYDELLALIADLADILAKPERVVTIIKEEMDEIKRKYANPRRTELMIGEVLSLEDEDLIEEEDVLITLSIKVTSNVLLKMNSVPKNVGAVVFKEQGSMMTILFVSWYQQVPMTPCSSLRILDGFIV